jgi:hypothetical protein
MRRGELPEVKMEDMCWLGNLFIQRLVTSCADQIFAGRLGGCLICVGDDVRSL